MIQTALLSPGLSPNTSRLSCMRQPISPRIVKIELPFAPMIYSGDLPPAGVCKSIARHQPVEVYRLPDRTAEIFALLYPSAYARVLEIAPNGWYRIDASATASYIRRRAAFYLTLVFVMSPSVRRRILIFLPQVEKAGLTMTKVCF